MTSFNSDDRVGIKVREESPTHDFCAHSDNVNLEIQSTINSTENIARALRIDSEISLRDLINSVNSSVSLTEDFVNLTFSFPKLYFCKLSHTILEEINKSKTIAIKSTSNSSERSECLKSQSKGNSNCRNMSTPINQGLSNIHEIMENEENVTYEFPQGIGSSKDTASVESEDESQTRSEIVENSKSACRNGTLTRTSSNLNSGVLENYRTVQIKLEDSTADETHDCYINTDLVECKAEVTNISEDDSQNIQILGNSNENVSIVENSFEVLLLGKYDSTEREANLITESSFTTGSGIKHQECLTSVHTQENENLNQTSIENLNIDRDDESVKDKCFKDVESGEDTNSSQISIDFNKSSEMNNASQLNDENMLLRSCHSNLDAKMKLLRKDNTVGVKFTKHCENIMYTTDTTSVTDKEARKETTTKSSEKTGKLNKFTDNLGNVKDSNHQKFTTERLAQPTQGETSDIIITGTHSITNYCKNSNLEGSNISEIDILEESQSTWQELFPLQKIKKIHTREIKFETPVYHAAKYFKFEILNERVILKVTVKPDTDISIDVVTLNSLECSAIPSAHKTIMNKEEHVQDSEKRFDLIDPNEECHMQSKYPNVKTDPKIVKESNAEVDKFIQADFKDVEIDLAIDKGDLKVSNQSLDRYLDKSISDGSDAESSLKIVRKSSESLSLEVEESPKYQSSDCLPVRTVHSSEPGVVEKAVFELMIAVESPDAECELTALNESSKIKPNQMEPVSLKFDVYPTVLNCKLSDITIKREYPDAESDLLERSEILEGDPVPESINEITNGMSDAVVPTNSPKSALNFTEEQPDTMTLSFTLGESRPEANRDAKDGKSKSVTNKISPRNEFNMMQPCDFSDDEPSSVLANECPEHATVPVTLNTSHANVLPSVEVCLGDPVSTTVNVLDEKRNKKCSNKFQENKSIPVCANELPENKPESTYFEEFEESDLRYVAQLPECEIAKIITNKGRTIEGTNNISESQADADSEHSSLNLQYSPDRFRNNGNEDSEVEICEIYEVCSPHEALSEQKDNATKIKQNSLHKREQYTKHKLLKIENFEVENSMLVENETSLLSVDPGTSSNFNTSPLISGTNSDIDISSNISEKEPLSKIETEYENFEHVPEELKSNIKKQVTSLKKGKKPPENKVGVKVGALKMTNKGIKNGKGIPKAASSNLLSDEVDAAPTRLRTKHYPSTSLAKDVIPENSQVVQDKTSNGFGIVSKDQNSEDSSTNMFAVRRSLRSRSQDLTISASQNIKKPDSLSQRSSGDTGKISKSFSQAERTVSRKKQAQTPDIKLKEHIAVATRSAPRRGARYNVLDHSQSAEIQEESNSTPPKTNIRTSNRIASASKSKERSILSTSTTSASARSNVNASNITTRKTRTKEIQEESNSTPPNTNIRTSNRIASASKAKERSILSTSTASSSTRSNVNASNITTRKTRGTKD